MTESTPTNMTTQASDVVLLTVPEACDQLRISRWMFYRLIQTRRLETIKIGSRRLVRASAVRDLVARLEREGD